MDPYGIPFWVLIISVISLAVAVISRPFSSYMKFIYPNAKYESMGNPYIRRRKISEIIDTKDVDSFKENLNTSKDYDIKGEMVSDIQKSLDDSFIENVEMMKKDSSKKMHPFLNAYLEKMDLHVIKKFLRDKIKKSEIDEKILDEINSSKNLDFLNELLGVKGEEITLVLKRYGYEKLSAYLKEEKKPDFLKINSLVDKKFLEDLENVEVPYKCEKAKNNLIKIMIDNINIKNVLRALKMGYNVESIKNMFLKEGREIRRWKYNEMAESESVSQAVSALEGTRYYDAIKESIERYNKEKSVQVLELALDKNFLNRIKDISQQNYTTIGPTLRFLISKEFEIRNLKIVVKGIAENLSSENIKKYMVTEET